MGRLPALRGAALLAVLLTSLSAPPLATLAAQQTTRSRIDEAAALLKNQKTRDALTLLQGIADDPDTAADPQLNARALFYLGQAYLQINDYPKAREAYERARIASQPAGDIATEADCVIGIALTHKNQAEYQASIALGREALRLYESIRDSEGAARSWQHIGSIQDLTGRHRDALESYGAARRLFGNSTSQQAIRFLNEIAITHKNLGNYQEAIDLYNEALAGLTGIGDRYGQAMVLNNLGNVQSLLGQTEAAISAFRRSLEIVRAIDERRGESMLLGNLGAMFLARGDSRRAFEFLQQQLRLTRELGNRNEEANALGGLGDLYEKRGDVDQARQSYERSLAIQREIGARSRLGSTLVALANLSLASANPDEAGRLAAEALALARATGAPELEWKARLAIARVAAAGGRHDMAIAELRAGAAIINNLRANVWSDAAKIGFVDERQEVFAELAGTLAAAGRLEEGLEAAEAGRARAFADLLEQRQVRVKAAEQPAFADLRAALADARENRTPLLDSAGRNASDQAVQSSGAIDANLARLRAAGGELASLITAESPTRAEIGALAMRLGSTFIEYVITERRVLSWVVLPDGAIHSSRIDLPRATLESLAADVKKAVDATSVTAAEAAALRSRLRELHRILIAPVAQWLPSSPDGVVVIVPHGALAIVPFAALEDAAGRPLVERHTLAFAPSIGVYRYTPAKRQPSTAPRSALVVADPRAPASSGMPPLPGARDEGRRIARQLGAGVVLLTGSRASEASVKQQAQKHKILHFATHGLVSAQYPLASSLLLSPGNREDGYLRADEIFSLSLDADLVVLSGCSTGLGRLSGDGVVGLSRAFIYAGTPAVIVSQWDVSDRATAFLMNAFYAQIRQRRGPAAALRRAQLDTRQRYPDIALWAAFLVVGEPG